MPAFDFNHNTILLSSMKLVVPPISDSKEDDYVAFRPQPATATAVKNNETLVRPEIEDTNRAELHTEGQRTVGGICHVQRATQIKNPGDGHNVEGIMISDSLDIEGNGPSQSEIIGESQQSGHTRSNGLKVLARIDGKDAGIYDL